MDILVIGISNVFSRRVLPALIGLDCVERIHLASRRSALDVVIPETKRGRFFSSYEAALRDLPVCLAYISLPNHLHAEWVRNALSAGFHVIVDKPAFLDFEEMSSILTLANQLHLCVAEATVWPFHPQVSLVRNRFSHEGTEPHIIQAIFSFPPLAASNFRNDPQMGGGSFYDLGAYAVSPGRVFFADSPVEVWCRSLERSEEKGIDTGFVLNAIYSRGRVFQGVFSFCTEYKNSLTVLGPKVSATIEPAFTINHDHQANLVIRVENKNEIVKIPASDIFASFISEVVQSIEVGSWSHWLEIIWQDANVLRLASKSQE